MMMEQPQPVNQASPDQGTATVNKRYSYIDQVLQDFRTAFRLRHTVLMSILIFSLFFVSAILVGILTQSLTSGVVLFFLGLILAIVLAWATAEPVSIYLYLREVREELEQYRQLYTPLAAFVNVYKTPVNYAASDPKNLDITDLFEQEEGHLMILGLPGAGKTIALQVYQYKALRQTLKVLWRWSHAKIPVYIPLRDYNAYLINNQKLPPLGTGQVQGTPQGELPTLLLAYLFENSELTGIHHLWPYLSRLIQQGRIAFLCDGLNELSIRTLEPVCSELCKEMETRRNRIVMTCREFDYQEQSVLSSLVDEKEKRGKKGEKEKHAKVAVISPLRKEQIQEFVDRYLAVPPADGQEWRYRASDIIELIKRTSLSHDCTNPFILVTMMQTMNGMTAERRRQITTRGQLLREFVSQLMSSELNTPEWSRRGLQQGDVVLFLSEVACTARRAGYRNAIRLSNASAETRGGRSRPPSPEELPVTLLNWLREPDVNAPEGEVLPTLQDLGMHPLHPPYDRAHIADFLDCTQDARVITLSQNGVLSFRHELIAEYFVAEYLYRLHLRHRPAIPFAEELLGKNVSSWSEPVTIWAGFVGNAMQLAGNLAAWANSNQLDTYNALVLSLACVSVVWAVPDAALASSMQLPSSVQEALQKGVSNREAREKLAPIFKRCAEEGGINVYRALLPLLPTTEGMADLLLLLGERDKRMPALLFDYLSEIADRVPYANQVLPLKQVIATFGPDMIARAAELSEPANNPYLRAAAIDILGLIPSQEAVTALLKHLGDPLPRVYEATIIALGHLGPDLALYAVVQELQKSAQDEQTQKIHMGALDILRRFLVKGTTSLTHYQQIIQALLHTLSGTYTRQAQDRARELLRGQAFPTPHPQDTRWQDVIKLLIQALARQDTTLITNVMNLLQEIGKDATPFLCEQLTLHSTEIARRRILMVLSEVRDLRALHYIRPLLADPSAGVQQEAAEALRKYGAESIPQLISEVLSPHSGDRQTSERATTVLKRIGRESVEPIADALKQVAPRGEDIPRDTPLLVDALVELKDARAVPALITLLQQTAPSNQQLAVRTIQALGTFEDVRVVPPLIGVLEYFGPPLTREAGQALSHLGTSRIGSDTLNALIAALDVTQETNKTRGVRQTLLAMQPFQKEALLEAFKQQSDGLTQQLMRLFHMKASETAQFLIQNLFHADARVQSSVRRLVGEIDRNIMIPWLIEALQAPDWRPLLTSYLLKYPESIPQLVQRLGDDSLGKAASEILFQFGSRVVPALQPGLEDTKARRRTQDLIVKFVQQKPQEVLPNVIRMFDPAYFGLPTLPNLTRLALMFVLTHDLADISLPALIECLQERRLVPDVSQTLKLLFDQQKERRAEVLQAVLAAFEQEALQEGAATTLKAIGDPAIPGLEGLITHPTSSVAANAARQLFSEMGPKAFPSLFSMYHDTSKPEQQRIALDIFSKMKTDDVRDGLIEGLLSGEPRDLEVAISLLAWRINYETTSSPGQSEILSALLDQAQGKSSNHLLRIMGALLLLNKKGSIEIAQQVLHFLYEHPQHAREYVQLLPLLGEQAIELLKKAVQSNEPSPFQIEVAGMLGMMPLNDEDIKMYIREMANSVVTGQGNQTRQLSAPEHALYLRRFGGLLASGNCDTDKLVEQLNGRLSSDAKEFLEVLLGHRKASRIGQLENQLNKAQREYEDKLNEKNRELARLRDESRRDVTRLSDTNTKLESQLEDKKEELKRAEQQAILRISALEREKRSLELQLNNGINQQP